MQLYWSDIRLREKKKHQRKKTETKDQEDVHVIWKAREMLYKQLQQRTVILIKQCWNKHM